MNTRQRLARQLQTIHHTNDPRQLIELLHIPYSQTKLPASMHGFTCRVDGQIGIIINSQLEESQLAYARAHELGHALLHDHTGHYLIAESTFILPGRYEREADEFARELLGEGGPCMPMD